MRVDGFRTLVHPELLEPIPSYKAALILWHHSYAYTVLGRDLVDAVLALLKALVMAASILAGNRTRFAHTKFLRPLT